MGEVLGVVVTQDMQLFEDPCTLHEPKSVVGTSKNHLKVCLPLETSWEFHASSKVYGPNRSTICLYIEHTVHDQYFPSSTTGGTQALHSGCLGCLSDMETKHSCRPHAVTAHCIAWRPKYLGRSIAPKMSDGYAMEETAM